MSQRDDEARPDPGEVVLDASGGVPAVAVGTAQEEAAEHPAVIRSSADQDVPAVAAGTAEAEQAPPAPHGN